MTKLSSVQQARREKMLAAGQEIILRNGLRGTTMEAIATAAGVAKPTLYKYFPDKDAIYAALVERIAEAVTAEFDAALARDGDIASRISAALTAKKKFAFKLLHSSPHAQELGGEDMVSQLEPLRQFEMHVENEITASLTPGLGKDARYMAQLLIACATGIGKHAKYAEQIGPAIRLVVEKVLA